MKQNIKRILCFIIIMYIALFSINYSNAHSGRTDANGGHRDNKNVSGLGPYHYHCGGHPAHLHPNGICPYSTSDKVVEEKKGTNDTTVVSSNDSKDNKDDSDNFEEYLMLGLLGGVGYIGYKKHRK